MEKQLEQLRRQGTSPEQLSLAIKGNRETVTNDAWTGGAYAIQFITNCTPTVLTETNHTGTASGIQYTAGTIIYGNFTAITVGSGETVRIYSE